MRTESFYDLRWLISTCPEDVFDLYTNVAKSCMTPIINKKFEKGGIPKIDPNMFTKNKFHPVCTLHTLGFTVNALYEKDKPLGRFLSYDNKVACMYPHHSPDIDMTFAKDYVCLLIYTKFKVVENIDLSKKEYIRIPLNEFRWGGKWRYFLPMPCIDAMDTPIAAMFVYSEIHGPMARLTFGKNAKGISLNRVFYDYGGYLLEEELKSGKIDMSLRSEIRQADVEAFKDLLK